MTMCCLCFGNRWGECVCLLRERGQEGKRGVYVRGVLKLLAG